MEGRHGPSNGRGKLFHISFDVIGYLRYGYFRPLWGKNERISEGIRCYEEMCSDLKYRLSQGKRIDWIANNSKLLTDFPNSNESPDNFPIKDRRHKWYTWNDYVSTFISQNDNLYGDSFLGNVESSCATTVLSSRLPYMHLVTTTHRNIL